MPAGTTEIHTEALFSLVPLNSTLSSSVHEEIGPYFKQSTGYRNDSRSAAIVEGISSKERTSIYKPLVSSDISPSLLRKQVPSGLAGSCQEVLS